VNTPLLLAHTARQTIRVGSRWGPAHFGWVRTWGRRGGL